MSTILKLPLDSPRTTTIMTSNFRRRIPPRLFHRLLTSIGILAAGSAWAASDVNVQSIDGRLATGEGEFDAGPWAGPARAFSAFLSSQYFTTDPGWNALGAGSPALPAGIDPLAPQTDLSWDYLPGKIGGVAANIFYWDGQGPVAFGLPPGGLPYQISLQARTGDFISTTATPGLVPGGAVVRTNSQGGIHSHRTWALDDNDGSLETDPADGIYLAAVRLRMEGFDRSAPAFVLFATPAVSLAAVGDAVAWTHTNAESLVPDFAADFNGDLAVDGFDLAVWQSGYGLAGAVALQVAGDGTFDATVDGADFLAWQRQHGSNLETFAGAPVAPAVAIVPEPSAGPMFFGLATFLVFLARAISGPHRIAAE
ncbi:MAG: hypothetical protein KF847_18825 [Pirellulales bacterium]|nr:hypothetical protein [Pirellulales bacterium]